MNIKTNTVLFYILSLLILSLIFAYVIEFGLGYKPCKLCIYQRYPYFLSILLIGSIYIFKKNIKIHLLLLSIISLFGSLLAFYHFGIEQGFFSEAAVCDAINLNDNPTKQDILKQLKENTISCKEVTFRLFGLSLASINTIFSFALSCIFLTLFKKNEINK